MIYYNEFDPTRGDVHPSRNGGSVIIPIYSNGARLHPLADAHSDKLHALAWHIYSRSARLQRERDALRNAKTLQVPSNAPGWLLEKLLRLARPA